MQALLLMAPLMKMTKNKDTSITNDLPASKPRGRRSESRWRSNKLPKVSSAVKC